MGVLARSRVPGSLALTLLYGFRSCPHLFGLSDGFTAFYRSPPEALPDYQRRAAEAEVEAEAEAEAEAATESR